VPLTPSQIVAELDKFIIGQKEAKRAVAIALRNRWRRQQVGDELRDEIIPKNIIMIGPTGVGKTEIARRLARLSDSPFFKVEASKFTEVGYVGRDVESMVRDLTELTITQEKVREQELVQAKAREIARERLLDLLLPNRRAPAVEGGPESSQPEIEPSRARERLRTLLEEGKLDERYVEIEVTSRNTPRLEIFSKQGVEEMDLNIGSIFGQMFPGQTKRRKVKVPEALELLAQEEAGRLVDMEAVVRQAISRVENSGIIFLDELDKIAARQGGAGPDVSREGVQRDLLPIVEGTTVSTKYGPVKTDHILFIASGAFHMSKVSDLIPELQGRFPIRVELDSLGEEDFFRILTEPANAMIKQYQALMGTENLSLSFDQEAIRAIARFADEINQASENIGARRLHTVMEKLLEEISFNTPDKMDGNRVLIDAEYVETRLAAIRADQDLSRYIL